MSDPAMTAVVMSPERSSDSGTAVSRQSHTVHAAVSSVRGVSRLGAFGMPMSGPVGMLRSAVSVTTLASSGLPTISRAEARLVTGCSRPLNWTNIPPLRVVMIDATPASGLGLISEATNAATRISTPNTTPTLIAPRSRANGEPSPRTSWRESASSTRLSSRLNPLICLGVVRYHGTAGDPFTGTAYCSAWEGYPPRWFH